MLDQLEQAGTLLSIAEIAATFAGFAALVTLFGRRRVAGSGAHDLLRLRLVITTSVIVVVAALIPVALSGFGLAVDLDLRLSAAAYLVLHYAAIVSFVRSYQPVRGHFPPDRFAVAIAAVVEALVQIALFAIVFGFFPLRHDGLYTAALVGTLAQAAFVFLRLVESTFAAIVGRGE